MPQEMKEFDAGVGDWTRPQPIKPNQPPTYAVKLCLFSQISVVITSKASRVITSLFFTFFFHFFGHLFIVLAGGIMFFDGVRQMDNGSGTSGSSGWPYGGC